MTNEQAGILFKAIFEYQLTGQIPELDFAMDMAFTPFLNQFIRDDEKYNGFKAKQIENGKKGGRPNKGEVILETQQNPKKPSLFSETQKSLNDSVSVNDSISKNKNESKNKSVSKTQPHLFSESEFCDFGKFESAFIGTDYEVADLRLCLLNQTIVFVNQLLLSDHRLSVSYHLNREPVYTLHSSQTSE